MKKTVFFLMALFLSVGMGITGLAWAKGIVMQPGPKPVEPQVSGQILSQGSTSLDQIVEMIVKGTAQNEIETFWRKILAANPQMDSKTVVNYIITRARQKLEGNIAMLKSRGAELKTANVDLQNALQKEQLLLQSTGNVQKMLNDTAMSVQRKTGG